MAREELYIGGIYIPLSKSLNASLTKSITDIQEPDKRKATYSKTVNIPNSKEAAEAFGGLFDLNLVDSSFDPTVKVDCRYVVDGEPIIEGYCQLKAIHQKLRTDISYDIVMFSVLANIFKDMGEDYLDEIDLSRWNHPFTKEIQQKSWETEVWDNDAGAFTPFAFGKGYVYPLADYGFSTNLNDFDFTQIPCAIYLKEYIDAIFAYTGKNYTSTFFDSTYFKKIVIPASPTNFQLDSTEIANRQFQANTPQFTSTGTTSSGNLTLNAFGSEDTIIFTNEVSDPSGLYNNANGKYTITSTSYQGLYDINALIDIAATFTPDTATAVKTTSDVWGHIMVYVNGVEQQAKPFYITSDDATFISGARSTTTPPVSYPDGDFVVDNKWSIFPPNTSVDSRTGDDVPNRYLITLNNVLLFNGDEVEIKVKAGYFGTKGISGFTNNYFIDSGGTSYTGNASITISTAAFYNKVVNTYPAEGSTMKIEKLIPKNVKMKDFFMSIVKRFNLFIDIDPNDTNNYIIEPRDTFLTTDIIDIDEKLDEGQDLTIIPMGRLDAADYHFSDKPDKDYLNETYTTTHDNRVYGDRKVLSTNEFVNKVKKIETIFSPTPLAAPKNSTRVLSTIIQQDNMGYPQPIDHNVRLWFYDGLKDGKAWNHINYVSVFQIPLPTTYTQYPYAGHFDDPFNATEDLNFGLVEEVYYDDNQNAINVTDSNVVNKYYSKMLQEYTAKESKIVEGMFNVTPNDFKTWDFRKLYFFRGAYFRLQKIEGYNPTGESLTKCVFLYLTNTPDFVKIVIDVDGDTGGTTPTGTGGGTVDFTEGKPSKGTKTSQNNDFNNTSTRGVEVQGKYNYVATDSFYIEIQGDSNRVFSEAENIKIQGDNNTIDAGVKNVTLINTDGITVTESDVTYINGAKVDTTAISNPSAVSEISASQDVETDVKTYIVDTSSADVTVTFDLAVYTYTEGQIWYFKKDSSSNSMIIDVNGGTIDGVTSKQAEYNNTSIAVQYDGGTGFRIV